MGRRFGNRSKRGQAIINLVHYISYSSLHDPLSTRSQVYTHGIRSTMVKRWLHAARQTWETGSVQTNSGCRGSVREYVRRTENERTNPLFSGPSAAVNRRPLPNMKRVHCNDPCIYIYILFAQYARAHTHTSSKAHLYTNYP